MSTDKQQQADEEFKCLGDTLGQDDSGLEKVLNIETARPLIGALPEQQRTVLMSRFFEDMTQDQIAEHIEYSQMHVSRLLAKALAIRSQVREPELANAG